MLHALLGLIIFSIAWHLLFGDMEKDIKELKEKQRDNHWMDRLPPPQAPAPSPNLGQMVEHSRRTGAHIQVVEKAEIVNGNLTAERHVKISQPYVPAQPVELSASVNPIRRYQRSYAATARFQD